VREENRATGDERPAIIRIVAALVLGGAFRLTGVVLSVPAR
jgi:hypothetical protein